MVWGIVRVLISNLTVLSWTTLTQSEQKEGGIVDSPSGNRTQAAVCVSMWCKEVVERVSLTLPRLSESGRY
jgi:hypothetical protein